MATDTLQPTASPDVGKPWTDVDTPALIVDLDRLEANVTHMAAITSRAGLDLRPHFKTHKSAAIARRQLDAGAVGLTVAKLDEAETLAAAGLRASVLVAFEIVAAPKLERAMALAARLPLVLALDSHEGARALAGAAEAAGRRVDVWIEVDCGLARCGVAPADAPALARIVAAEPHLRLGGVFTHAGQAYAAGGADEIRRIAATEAAAVVDAARAIRETGIDVAVVSAGSTPTARFLVDHGGLTEIRPGTYVFYDALQVALGTVSDDACAVSIAATVVSRPTATRAVIDAGSKSFGLDRGAHASSILSDYGRLVDVSGVLERLSEEHGVLRVPETSSLAVGDRVRIVPNHVCTTTNLGRRYHAIRNGIVEAILLIDAAGAVH